MSYFGFDEYKDSLPRLSGNRLTETPRRWQSNGVKFIDEYEVNSSPHYSHIWQDDMKHKYGKSKSSINYKSKKRPTSAESSATSSISSYRDSSEVSAQVKLFEMSVEILEMKKR